MGIDQVKKLFSESEGLPKASLICKEREETNLKPTNVQAATETSGEENLVSDSDCHKVRSCAGFMVMYDDIDWNCYK